MQYKLFFIPFYAIYTLSTHIDRNNSDVIIKYTGHNEAERVVNNKFNERMPQTVTEAPKVENVMSDAEEVVFIPNEKEVLRNEDYRENVKVHDLIEHTNIDSIMKVSYMVIPLPIIVYALVVLPAFYAAKAAFLRSLIFSGNATAALQGLGMSTGRGPLALEKPAEDIIFISGKNNENNEPSVDKPKENRAREPASKKIKLDCRNLDCNNTLDSICGMKEEDKKFRYRIFLNECFFRKVNCAFTYASNRYKVVPMEHCKNIGGRLIPKAYAPMQSKPKKVDTRRSFSSRRTLNMGIDGAFCGHSCPDHCTEDYEPQCAISTNGERRVFVNHCVLDYNSCLYGAVWQRRPLSECVGGKKADMRQNRGFIGWLQRVGIVDKRGRLVLN